MYLVLASQSPRRRDLLIQAGYRFQINVSRVDETVEETNPIDKVMAIAKKKGLDVFSKYTDDQAVVLSADTIVVINDYILGKPKDKEDARLMLKMLQNNTHQVYTAVFIKSNDNEQLFYEKTDVLVSSMTDEEIEQYISTTEPYDKAGGYAIQGIFSKYISKINGDYYNVMGLPINKVREALKQYSFEEKTYCLVCKNEVKPDDVFCQHCGTKLKNKYENQVCPHCHKLNDSKNKYCIYCGKELLGKVAIVYNKNECMICHHINDEKSQYCESCGALLETTKEEKENVNVKKSYCTFTFITGIISLGLVVQIIGGYISFIPGILAIIFGIISFKRESNVKNLLGFIFGIIGCIASITMYLSLFSNL